MAQKELVIERVLAAPREKVWRAWTDPEQVKLWWGPKGFTAPTVKIDLRVGGKYLFCMRGAPEPGGEVRDFWSTGIYREIVSPEKLVMTDSFADENGQVVPASHYGMEGMPLELTVSVTFAAMGDKTRMTLRHAGWSDDANRELAGAGWGESFDKLAAMLAG